MASYDNKPLDGNGLSHLWAKIKAMFALKTELPAAGSTTPAMDGTGATGTSTAYARADHVHPTDTSRAPLASPALTGTPTAPTAAAGTNTTQIATTAFVKAATDALDTGVTGVKGSSESTYRTGQVNITAANIGVEAGAQKNQNAFSLIKVGSTTIGADTSTDTLTLTAGSNVTLTPDSTNDSVTIAATDTTYSDFTGATSSAAGAHGLVPTPDSGEGSSVLTGGGDWKPLALAGSLTTLAAHVDLNMGSGSDVERLSRVTITSASTTSAGVMSSADKTKLNGIEAGAQAHVAPTNAEVIAALGYTPPTSDTNTTYTLTQDSTDGHKITLTPSSGSATTITIPDNDTKALGSMTGTLGVGHGGTGVSTLGAGVVYHSASGTGALSSATATNIVSAIGNSAVNRATADASGNNIASTYLTTSAASATYLTQTSAASTYATKSEIVGLYKYKGSVATESDLPASPSTGDVYNIEAASTYGAAGANVAWNGTAWDSLGEIFQLDPLTNAEIDAICV